jgi:hypothetical protein
MHPGRGRPLAGYPLRGKARLPEKRLLPRRYP